MKQASTPGNPTKPSWNPWPFSIIAFFVVALLGCGTFVAYCSRHPADLITANYYEDEVRYQGQIDRLQRTQQRAQQVEVAYDSARKLLTIALPPELSGARLSGQVQLYRPSAANLDRQLKLEPDAMGHQAIGASALEPGLWRVRVSWTVDQQEYFAEQKVIVDRRTVLGK